MLRLFLGVGYLAVFMAYVALGRVFPFGYTYWNLPPSFAGPVIYLFLWLLGVWNMLNTALHRHQFGRSLRGFGGRLSNGRASPDHMNEAGRRGRTTERSTSRRWWGGRRAEGAEVAPDVEAAYRSPVMTDHTEVTEEAQREVKRANSVSMTPSPTTTASAKEGSSDVEEGGQRTTTEIELKI
jgi:hypothetical protein